MIIDERSDRFCGLTNSAMCTSETFPTNVPTSIAPNQQPPGQGITNKGDGVIPCGSPDGAFTGKHLILTPFGLGAAGQQFLMQVFCWQFSSGQNLGAAGALGLGNLFIPLLLAQYTVTLGNNTGTPASDIGGQYNFAGQIVQTYGPTALSGAFTLEQYVSSPGNNFIAFAKLATQGARFIEVAYQMGTAAAMNAFYRLI